MAKLTLNDLSNITGNEQSAINTINNNHALIETALENTLSRDGTTPNAMGADLDMNSNDILNVNDLEAVTIEATTVEADSFTVDGISINVLLLDWEGQWLTATSYLVGDLVYNAGSSYICTVAHTSSAITQPAYGANWEDYWDLVALKGDPGTLSVPATSTDNAVARFDGTTGNAIQNSGLVVSDTVVVTGATQLGVNATPDATNKLSVNSDAVLFNHNGTSSQVKVNKNATANTASHLFQTNFSGRAEFGTIGSDDFQLKTSPDGSAFTTALTAASANGSVTIPVDLTLANTGLHLLDTNATHDLIIAPGSNLTADRTLTLTTGDANRTLTLTADSSIGGTAYVSGGTDVTVADGGTGVSSLTAYAVLCGGTTGTGNVQSIASVGTSGQVLTSNGAGALPTFQAPATAGSALLTSGSVSSAANLSIVLTSYTAYRAIQIHLFRFIPVTDDVDLFMRLSTNGGSSYDSGAADYKWTIGIDRTSSTTPFTRFDDSDSQITLLGSPTGTESISNTAAEGGCTCVVTIPNQTNTAAWPIVYSTGMYIASGSSFLYTGSAYGVRMTAQDTDAVQFFFETGNISSGTYAVYGLV